MLRPIRGKSVSKYRAHALSRDCQYLPTRNREVTCHRHDSRGGFLIRLFNGPSVLRLVERLYWLHRVKYWIPSKPIAGRPDVLVGTQIGTADD